MPTASLFSLFTSLYAGLVSMATAGQRFEMCAFFSDTKRGGEQMELGGEGREYKRRGRGCEEEGW